MICLRISSIYFGIPHFAGATNLSYRPSHRITFRVLDKRHERKVQDKDSGEVDWVWAQAISHDRLAVASLVRFLPRTRHWEDRGLLLSEVRLLSLQISQHVRHSSTCVLDRTTSVFL
jgi:hypothetical protein